MKRSLYAVAAFMIVLGLAGFIPYPERPSQPKPVELADMVSLRQLPGADGCEPGSVKAAGVPGFPDSCVDATVYQ